MSRLSAEKQMEHLFSYLALGEIKLGSPVRFNYEYKRGIETPLVFGPWMDYRNHKEYGDFKYFWEVPRWQHLVVLSKAYFLFGESRYADEVFRQLHDFWDETPYLFGVNWTVAMEAGIRLMSLSWITFFLKSYLSQHPEKLDLIEGLVRMHVHFVSHNYARFSSANNHLVGEAAGVFTAATCFQHLPGMKRQRERALVILCREIQLQHHLDGVNKEQTTHYQMFAWYFFALAGILGRDNGIPFPESYWSNLHRSAEFLSSLGRDHHSIPQIGDSDDGRAIVLNPSDDDITVLVQTAALLFDDPQLALDTGPLSETVRWFLGEQVCQGWAKLILSERQTRCQAFPDGGYYILAHKDWPQTKMVFDCGPLGMDTLAAHGHADALSILLDVEGIPFLVDPGTYTYQDKDPMRDYFRSTRAHNSLCIDDCDQSEMAGPFLWRQKARATLESWCPEGNCLRICARHDGYQRLNDPVVHRREATFDTVHGLITLLDEVVCQQSHCVSVAFHFAPTCEVESDGPNKWLLTNRKRQILLELDARWEVVLYHANTEPLCGWYSDSYDQLEPATTLVCSATPSESSSYLTLIRI